MRHELVSELFAFTCKGISEAAFTTGCAERAGEACCFLTCVLIIASTLKAHTGI